MPLNKFRDFSAASKSELAVKFSGVIEEENILWLPGEEIFAAGKESEEGVFLDDFLEVWVSAEGFFLDERCASALLLSLLFSFFSVQVR